MAPLPFETVSNSAIAVAVDDIVAGAILALISFKLINTILEKKYAQYKFSNLLLEDNSQIYSYVLF